MNEIKKLTVSKLLCSLFKLIFYMVCTISFIKIYLSFFVFETRFISGAKVYIFGNLVIHVQTHLLNAVLVISKISCFTYNFSHGA